jgi:hypothetical protein
MCCFTAAGSNFNHVFFSHASIAIRNLLPTHLRSPLNFLISTFSVILPHLAMTSLTHWGWKRSSSISPFFSGWSFHTRMAISQISQPEQYSM